MAIQALDSVNEGQTSYIAVEFTDEAGQAVAPTAVSYRVDDLDSGESLLGDTDCPAPAASVTIELAPAVNRVIDDDKGREVHVCTISATYGGGKKITGELRFCVVNLPFHEEAPEP